VRIPIAQIPEGVGFAAAARGLIGFPRARG
jgi:hypothetical protein